MNAKKITGFKRLGIISVVLLGVLVIKNWPAPAGTSNPVFFDRNQQKPYTAIVAQNQSQRSPEQNAADSPEKQESESKTDGKRESAVEEKKPLKDFHPSEKIEADQAVDFPYDI